MSGPTLPSAAKAGSGTIDGAVWRPGDPNKHLGPPGRIKAHQSDVFLKSALFQTRCGLGAGDGDWREQAWGESDDYWCPACLTQAGMPFELYDDD